MTDRMENVDSFRAVAREFAMQRRCKDSKFYREPLRGPWGFLGRGHFGEAWEHADYPGLVLKISGPAGWGNGEEYSGYWGNGEEYSGYSLRRGNPQADAWPAFADYCMNNNAEHLPEVYHLERMSEWMTFGIVKRYESLGTYSDEYDEHCDDMEEFRAFMYGHLPDATMPWAWGIKAMASGLGYTVDLHEGNFMYDRDKDTWVVTDPFSFKGNDDG